MIDHRHPRAARGTAHNWSLLIGVALVVATGMLAVMGPALAPRDPLATHPAVKIGDTWIGLPYPPFTVPGFPLGSDTFGRDLLSRLVWGVRPTILLVTIVSLTRLLLGFIVGTTAGWSDGWPGRLTEGAITVALAVPVLFATLVVITAIGIQLGLVAFLVGLAVTGWADTGRLVSEQTRRLRSQPYIEAARAMGASGGEIVARHVVRQITPMLGMLLAFEAGSTLMVVAALGFLGYYVGGAFWIEVTDFSAQAVSGLPELGQMLANSWQVFKPWATFATGTVVFLAVLGFNLLGEGLRRRLSFEHLGRRSVVSEWIGRAGARVEEVLWTSFSGRGRRRMLVIAVVAVALAAAAIAWNAVRHRSADRAATSLQGLPLPGGHGWAGERRDPQGSLASPATELIPATVRWVLPDADGFSGGPVVDAAGNIYVTSNAGALIAAKPAGELLWRATLPALPVGTPAVGPSNDPQALACIYVTDRNGGLSAVSASGDLLWRFQSRTGRRASSGPVVGPDGTVYYTAVDRVEAVSSGGESVWTSPRLPGKGEVVPRLDPEGEWLFVQDAAVDLNSGGLAQLAVVEMPGKAGVEAQYVIGGDRQTYLKEDHAMILWRRTAAGTERVQITTWESRGSTVFLPVDGGVTGRQTAWLLYGSLYDDLRLVFLGPNNRLLGNMHYPMREGRVVATDAVDRAYACGRNRIASLECVAFAPGTNEPVWRVSLTRGDRIRGGALVPGRLYVTTDDGFMFAIGEE